MIYRELCIIAFCVLFLIPGIMFAIGRALGLTHRIGAYGQFLYGVGTLIIAMATGMAAFKADDLLDRVINVQRTADDIRTAVNELLDERANLIIERHSIGNAAVNNPDASAQEIENGLQQFLDTSGTNAEYKIPPEKIKELTEKLQAMKTPADRQKIIKQYMYVPKKSEK
jgi:hypothetical protein